MLVEFAAMHRLKDVVRAKCVLHTPTASRGAKFTGTTT